MRIAAIGDLHCEETSAGEMRLLLEGIEQEADLLMMAGDLTNMGRPKEMSVLLNDLYHFPLPIVAVVGNHDHESDSVEILIEMMIDSGIHVLNCSTYQLDDVGFVGTKGFCGGFGKRAVQGFGERALKAFVQAGIDEAACLDDALKQLTTTRKIAVLHYAPIVETLEGEAREVYPFLGSSLLADALDRHGVDLIVHGHSHNGSPQGYTQGGIPVHNVSRFVQKRSFGYAYRVFHI
jgi:Icc-related predicted phosphoesterase